MGDFFRDELNDMYKQIEKKVILNYVKMLKNNLLAAKPNLTKTEIFSEIDRTLTTTLKGAGFNA